MKKKKWNRYHFLVERNTVRLNPRSVLKLFKAEFNHIEFKIIKMSAFLWSFDVIDFKCIGRTWIVSNRIITRIQLISHNLVSIPFAYFSLPFWLMCLNFHNYLIADEFLFHLFAQPEMHIVTTRYSQRMFMRLPYVVNNDEEKKSIFLIFNFFYILSRSCMLFV